MNFGTTAFGKRSGGDNHIMALLQLFRVNALTNKTDHYTWSHSTEMKHISNPQIYCLYNHISRFWGWKETLFFETVQTKKKKEEILLYCFLYVNLSIIHFSRKSWSEEDIKWGGFEVSQSNTLTHVNWLVQRSRNLKPMKQSCQSQLQNLKGKRYSRAHPSTAPKRHQLKILASNVDVFVITREKPFGPKLVGLGPNFWVSLELWKIDQEASARWNMVATNGAVFHGFMGDWQWSRRV